MSKYEYNTKQSNARHILFASKVIGKLQFKLENIFIVVNYIKNVS